MNPSRPSAASVTLPSSLSSRARALAACLAVACLAVAGLAATAVPAGAQEASDPALTIYMQNLALVRAEVDRPVPAGESTVRVDGLPGDADLTSLMVLDPAVTLLGVHGRRSYQTAGRGSAISLALDLRAERAVEGLRIAYLTGGIGWGASYAMVVGTDDRSARIDGYATITNNSGTGYEHAAVQLLAGTVNVEGGGRRPVMMDQLRVSTFEMAPAAPQLSGEPFSGFHLYEVDAPLTLESGDSRRIRLMGADEIRVDREYVLPGQVNVYQRMEEPQRQEAVIRYRVERPEGTGFADLPLPSGTVRVFQPDDEGRLQLLGADAIPNTPAEEVLLLTVGRAFDIGGTRTQTAFERVEGSVHESAWEVELVNRTDERVVVQVVEEIQGDWEILESSHEAQRLSAHRLRFDVPVPADGEATLTYRVRVRR